MDDDDPALWRSLLLSERRLARRDIGIGLALIGSAIVVALVGMLGNHAVLTVATLYIPVVVIYTLARVLPNALGRHARASFKLHQLHARNTGLPVARVVDTSRE